MKSKMLSERKRKENLRNFLCSKFMSSVVMSAIITTCFMCVNCFAAGGDAITTAKTLLSKAATAGGGLWAVWGLVSLGMAIKDHNGPGIGGAVWQIVGGAISLSRTHKKSVS